MFFHKSRILPTLFPVQPVVFSFQFAFVINPGTPSRFRPNRSESRFCIGHCNMNTRANFGRQSLTMSRRKRHGLSTFGMNTYAKKGGGREHIVTLDSAASRAREGLIAPLRRCIQ